MSPSINRVIKMKLLCSILLVITLIGCGSSNTSRDSRYAFELRFNINIIRVRHFEESTRTLHIFYAYHNPAIFWVPGIDSTITFVWKVTDICDNVYYISSEFTDIKSFNRIDDPYEYFTIALPAAREYYEQRKSK